ncbi:MAG: glycosyltransferase family 2 protein [Planctomycetaceae bacterium]
MLACVYGLVLLLTGLLALTSIWGISFAWYFRANRNLSRGNYAPKVCIILPLRGPDPYLKRCLHALAIQSYSNFLVYVVVDNEHDPARTVVEDVLRETNTEKVQLDFLREKPATCSLRSAALIQAYNSLPEDWEVIVQTDADAHPYPEWLNDLLAGLVNPEVGIACGFRWFSPHRPTLGSLVRHVWNCGAITQMLVMKIGWGGSMAIKREAFDKANLRDKWSSALFDDNVTTKSILSCGYQLKMVPRTAMINEEDTDLRGCCVFIQRQILNIQLYHQSYPFVLFYSLFSAVVHTAMLIMVVLCFLCNEAILGTQLIGIFIVYIMIQSISIWIGELLLKYRHRVDGRPPVRLSPITLPLAVCLTLIIYPYCVVMSLMTKSVTWRGITYTIRSPFEVQRENYEPFQASPQEVNKSL